MIREFTIRKTETGVTVIPKTDTLYNNIPFELDSPRKLFEFMAGALGLNSEWTVVLRKRRKA